MISASEEVVDELLPHTDVLQKTVSLLSDDIQVANLATKILVNLGTDTLLCV
jgi:hypothetical protein